MFPTTSDEYKKSALPFVFKLSKNDISSTKGLPLHSFAEIIPDAHSLRVLIIEDEHDVVLSELLVINGYGIVPQDHKTKQLQFWSLSQVDTDFANVFHSIKNSQPHLIITDVMHPFRDGFETIEFIKNKIEWKIPVVIVSATGFDKKKIQKGLELGAIDFIAKPFDLLDFYHRIHKILDHSNPYHTPVGAIHESPLRP